MSSKVFIEEHLEQYLKSLAKRQLFIPGVIIGQFINGNYHVVHLSAITVFDEDTTNNTADVLTYQNVGDLLANSETIFQKAFEVSNLLPGGSHVLGLFCIVPQDVKGIQPLDIDFYELNQRLNENECKKRDNKWNHILLNYSTITKKSYCYIVGFDRLNGTEKKNYKAIDPVFGSFDNDWITFVGTFNFGALDRLIISEGPGALFSIRDSLLEKFESILNESICTFNENVYDENKILKDIKCDTTNSDNILKNVVTIEFYREVDSGHGCKNASIKVERGKGRIFVSGLCSLAIPFNHNGTIKDALKAIHEDAMQTFSTRLKMHLESLLEEESIEEEDGGDANVVHETPRRVLILKTEGSRFAFSDYVFPGEAPVEALYVAGEILNLPEEKMELYDLLEKGRHSYYETLPDIDSSSSQDSSTVTSNNNTLIYFAWAALILAILAYVIKQTFM